MTIREKILVIEDEKSISHFISTVLNNNGYEAMQAQTGEEALSMISSHCPDLIVLDLGLPDMDGLEVLRSVRKWSSLPIVVVSARNHERDKVEALDAGADDYVTKPFRLAELLARVRALLRRQAAEPVEGELRAQDIRMDVAAHRAFVGDVELSLTAKEFDLLRVLLREAGSVVARDTLMREVWGPDPTGSTKTLDMHVSWLRRKLGDDATDPHYITTVRGMGFRFENAR